MKEKDIILINKEDNVVTALLPLKKGTIVRVDNRDIEVSEDIDVGHKMAIEDILEDRDIIKYGAPIGHARQAINSGSFVHVHNISTNLDGVLEYVYQPENVDVVESNCNASFQGYLRPDGDVGIRNEIWIINTVGCVNKVAERLVHLARNEYAHRKIDGIHFFSHPYGCSQMGDDQRNTQDILAGLVNHPNAGGVLVLGLGCENNNIEEFQRVLKERGPWDPNRVKFLNTQDVEDEEQEGMELLGELVTYAEEFARQSVPMSKLKVGLKCGGSDGFSGITGNPLLGLYSDALVACGGTSLLTEVPEMFGAETILMNRCVSEEVFNRCVDMINDFKEYFIRHDQVIYDNPSPGNKEGGISTLEEKSLGCTQKGGTSPVIDVLEYGQPATKKGLNLLNGPGNDIVAVTALAASGAHLVLFTTGRGTPLGGPVPTVKISTNSDLARKKKNWIDFDAGVIVKDETMEDVAEEFFRYITDLASGKRTTRNEERDFREIAIFKDGVTL
ncbi:MAG TPA: altronate dehydratase family protein [Clostridia bacterium]|nr:altronate dehydratase family protein [Clostridia bacterium]